MAADSLDALAAEIGYSDGADDESGGVDALIDYKNALEDRCRRVEGEQDRTEAALAQCQHIAYDGLVALDPLGWPRGSRAKRLPFAVARLEKVNRIAEGGEADPEFVAMLAAADED